MSFVSFYIKIALNSIVIVSECKTFYLLLSQVFIGLTSCELSIVFHFRTLFSDISLGQLMKMFYFSSIRVLWISYNKAAENNCKDNID